MINSVCQERLFVQFRGGNRDRCPPPFVTSSVPVHVITPNLLPCTSDLSYVRKVSWVAHTMRRMFSCLFGILYVSVISEETWCIICVNGKVFSGAARILLSPTECVRVCKEN